MYTYTAHCFDGLYKSVKRVVADNPLRYAPYSQAGWRNFKNGVYLVSYASLVFKANKMPDGRYTIEPMDVMPSYSRTTSRQTTKALKELGYGPKEIADIKKALNKGETIIM